MEDEGKNIGMYHVYEHDDAKTEDPKLTVKHLGVIAGILIATLGAFASTLAFIDQRYVSQELHDSQFEQYITQLSNLDEKHITAINELQRQNTTEFNRVYKAIKDGTALPLIVRRNVLLARFSTLTDQEQDELSVIQKKLDELNIK